MRSFDLIIIGTGSGNSIVDPSYDDWDVAIVERALFGGTCLNVGCIPSKMLVYTAELAEAANNGERYGIDTRFVGADWSAIRDRVFGRIDPIAASGEQYRKNLPNVTVYGVDARFVGPKQLQVGEEIITADKIVLAAGARAFVPDIAGLAESDFHTSDTIMRIEALPKRLTVIGGGYIAAELGNVFGSLGSEVTFLLRGHTMLRAQDRAISERFTKIYADKFDVRKGASIDEVRREGNEIVLETNAGEHRCDELLVATGRIPNSDQLKVAATGVATDDGGYVITDAQLRTNVEGIWALGDITNPVQLKHVANHEARVVSHNLIHPDDPVEVDHRFIPAAVFGHPQVASVGLTEEQCSQAGLPYRVAINQYASAAYGWAMEDTESFCKLIVNTETRKLLGAHLLGPQASTLIQQLIQAMVFDLSADDIATKQYYIHPALPEVVEQALLEL
ncbi:MAG: mycothione reductase [Acidimicrobiaceae bacterium]|nr:mycothione reductase [Acidimicrobiaceae bacterium]MYA74059.1 mycothione reductase [Acidimicrobiaceae bacterium]MYD06308.1 mycothione reductase [Acidimicrobiaceae bacterium]MYG55342.1 mycothione reductase [Acidimicrobiaceae bacterium]MYI59303.1 mycothione reductase [Acidimicrobiaceae bacterium]